MSDMPAPSNAELQKQICKQYEDVVLGIAEIEDKLGSLRGKAQKMFETMCRLRTRYADELRIERINSALNKSEEIEMQGRDCGHTVSEVRQAA